MNQNGLLTGVKPQSQQIGRVQGLIEFLAATSCTISDMVQAPTTLWAWPFKWDFQKITHLTHFERLGIVFMKTYEADRNMNAKEKKCGNDYLGVFERVCLSVCACRVYVHECVRLKSWGSVLWLEHGHWDYYRGAVFSSLQNPVWTLTSASHVQTQGYTRQCASECMDICFEFVALNERWWPP